MDRTDETLTPAAAPWLADPRAQTVCRAIEAGGHQVLFVGGCVRNALLGLAVSDVDLSTDAVPERVIEMALAAGLKAVPTGVDHGTITVVVEGAPFEVTTFRRDMETDGRRAVVAFSDDIAEDARRRDFTLNALYATSEGRVIDPLGGLPDLRARRIRFIENANARIQEDYLRILRFFRFSALYGDPATGFDCDAMDAIARNIAGLETLSAERVGQEMRKLLSAPDPAPALSAMRSTGVLHGILPGADVRWIAPLVHVEAALGLSPAWLCRLAALGGDDVPDRLRLSKAEGREYVAIRETAFGRQSLAEIAYRHGEMIAQAAMVLRAVMAERVPDSEELKIIGDASRAKFPIKGTDLQPEFEGPALGRKLVELEARWIDSGFTLKRTDLLRPG